MDFNPAWELPEILVKFLLTVYLWNKFFFYIITCGISYDHLYFNSILVAICGYAVTNDHRVLQFFFWAVLFVAVLFSTNSKWHKTNEFRRGSLSFALKNSCVNQKPKSATLFLDLARARPSLPESARKKRGSGHTKSSSFSIWVFLAQPEKARV